MTPPDDFRPLPLLGNPHVQTFLGALLPGCTCPQPQRRHVVELHDGDALLLHENTPRSWRPGAPVAVLIHGLTGCHLSGYIQRMAVMLLASGVRVFRIDLRGAGEGVHVARGFYHAGRTEDVREALMYLHRLAPASPLWLAGVSLGGNVSLKLAGELPEHPVPHLARVAALNPPIDLERCSVLLELSQNRFYENRFLRDLIRSVQRRHRLYPDLPPIRFPRQLTVRQFDDLYTAPRVGFRDVADYYRRASSYPFIPRIPIPALILTARDDPFVDPAPFEEVDAPAHVRVHIAPGGGHVGFVGFDGAGGLRWAERRLVDWLADGYRPK